MNKWTIKKKAATYEDDLTNEIKEADEKIKELKDEIKWWEEHKIYLQNKIKQNKSDSGNSSINNKVNFVVNTCKNLIQEYDTMFNDLKQKAGVSNLRNLINKYNQSFFDQGKYPQGSYYNDYKKLIDIKQLMNRYLTRYTKENNFSHTDYDYDYFKKFKDQYSQELKESYNNLLKLVDYCNKHNIK